MISNTSNSYTYIGISLYQVFSLGRLHPLYQVLFAAYRSTCWQVTLP